MAPISPAVETSDLSVAFGSIIALDNASISFPAGEITGVAGPDGAGKTTLLRLLAGLLVPTRGKILFQGSPERPSQNNIGYMPQHFGLYEDLSVIANMRLQADLRSVTGKEREEAFSRLLRFTALAPFTDRLAGNLSGGMKQKLGIACALLGSPRLLLLDEPGVGVDPQSRRELWTMVQALKQDGMTIIWSTAYMDEAQRCPSVLILDKGHVLYQGKPEELTDRLAGRVFLVRRKFSQGMDVGQENRKALLAWSEKRDVEDALIQAGALRIAIAQEAGADLRKELKNDGAIPAKPDLEDAYMALVGGISHRPSPLLNLPRKQVSFSKPIIIAENLTKKFGNFIAADNISLSVRPGEVFGLLGPNGAGKTTTFRMLCGLLKPTSGTCHVDGVNLLRSGSKARSRLGYMAQKFSLYQDISVAENIRVFAGLYGLDNKKRKEAAGPLIEAMELEPWLKTKTGALPLGLKQRLSLLCAIVHNPPALFLDEPTSGVDVRTRRDFWKQISALTATGTAILVTTHFMEEAEYCDQLALLYRGTIISAGSPAQLRASVGEENATLEDAFIMHIENYDASHPYHA